MLKYDLVELVFGKYTSKDNTIENVKNEELMKLIEGPLVDIFAECYDFYSENGWENIEILSRDWDDYVLTFDPEDGTFELTAMFEVSREKEDYDEDDEDAETEDVVSGSIDIDLNSSFQVTGKSMQLEW